MPAATVEHLRVDDPTHGHVDVVRADPLEERARLRTRDLELGEARLVEQSRALARRDVLGHDRRRPVFAGPAPRLQRIERGILVRPEPVRALPAGLLAELGPERLEARVGGRDLERAARLVVLARVLHVVVLRVDLVGARERIPAAPIVRAEPPDVHLRQVHRGLAVDDPFGGGPADTGATGDAVGAEAGSHEEAPDLGLAQDEVVVGGERLGTVDEAVDLGRPQRGDQVERALRDRLEPLPPLLEQPVVEVGRDRRVDVPRVRVALVAADDEPADLLADVHEVVRIAQRREARGDARRSAA